MRLRPSGVICVAPASTISSSYDLPSHTRCCKRNTPPQLATARRSQRLYEYATDRRVRGAPAAPNKRRRTRAESRGAPRRAGRALIHTDHSHDMPVGGSAPGGSHLVVHRNIAAKACIGHGSPRSCRNRQEERRIHSPHAPSCQDELGEVDRYVSRGIGSAAQMAPSRAPPEWRRRGRHRGRRRGRRRGRHRGEALSRGGRRPRPHQGR
jgi:hypothetical protein